MRLLLSTGTLVLLTVNLLACGGAHRDADSLAAALADAAPGEVIEIAAREITGAFVVPEGVTLSGNTGTILIAPAGEVAVTVHSGPELTTVRNLELRANGSAALLLDGAGAVSLEALTVDAPTGLGVGVDGLAELSMSGVTVIGAVTQENATEIPGSPDLSEWPTHGIVLLGVGTATLTGVTVEGFGVTGATLVDTNLDWRDGDISRNLGVGLLMDGGAVTLDKVSVCQTFQGGLLPPAYGVVASGGVQLDTFELVACGNEGVGVLHHDATGNHVDLDASRNQNAAVWLQSGATVGLLGSKTQLVDNDFAGIVAVDAGGLVVQDALIQSTRLSTRTAGQAGLVEVGDGIQLLRSTAAVTLSGVTFSGNERVGLLIDADGGAIDGLTLESITIDGTGTQLGAVLQNAQPDPTWAEGVLRQGATAANDAAFTGSLDVVGIVGPSLMPGNDALRADGLGALLGP